VPQIRCGGDAPEHLGAKSLPRKTQHQCAAITSPHVHTIPWISPKNSA